MFDDVAQAIRFRARRALELANLVPGDGCERDLYQWTRLKEPADQWRAPRDAGLGLN